MRTHEDLALENFRSAPNAATREWRITMYFYAVVHAVSHVLFGVRPAPMDYDHGKRAVELGHHPALKKHAGPYRELERLSRTARYRPDAHPMGEGAERRASQIARDVLTAAGLAV